MAFRFDAWLNLPDVAVGRGVRFDVSVRTGGGAGRLLIGDNVCFGYSAAPRAGDGAILLQPRSAAAEIRIGGDTVFSNNVSVIALERVSVGQGCLIGDAVQIVDADFHEIDPARRRASPGVIRPVEIGDNVWLGSRVIVLRGVSIGDNSVVGAGSVVNRSIPANSVAAGVPARVIRTI